MGSRQEPPEPRPILWSHRTVLPAVLVACRYVLGSLTRSPASAGLAAVGTAAAGMNRKRQWSTLRPMVTEVLTSQVNAESASQQDSRQSPRMDCPTGFQHTPCEHRGHLSSWQSAVGPGLDSLVAPLAPQHLEGALNKQLSSQETGAPTLQPQGLLASAPQLFLSRTGPQGTRAALVLAGVPLFSGRGSPLLSSPLRKELPTAAATPVFWHK